MKLINRIIYLCLLVMSSCNKSLKLINEETNNTIFLNINDINMNSDKPMLEIKSGNRYIRVLNIKLMEENERIKKIGENDLFLSFTRVNFLSKDSYSTIPIYLHVIPEGEYYRFKHWNGTISFYEKGKNNGHGHSAYYYSSEDWLDAGTSEDKENIYTTVFEYYTKNIATINND